MAPLMYDDDLVRTISDDEIVSDEELSEAPSPVANGTKRKRDGDSHTQSTVKKQRLSADDEDNKHEDFDPEFEFSLEDGTTAFDDYEALVGDGIANSKPTFDLEASIKRRGYGIPKQVGEQDLEDGDGNEGELGDNGSEASFEGFGVGAEMQEDMDDGEDDGDSASGSDDEDEDVAIPTPHPEDMGPDSASETEDQAEQERAKAFFAAPAQSMDSQSSESFLSMSLSRPILKGLASIGFDTPTPIQSKTIPVALTGKDIVGGAVTGSGKTAAFIIPILERLLHRPNRTAITRVAILAPTRELALQCFNVAKKLASFTDITFGQAIGGLNLREQERALKQKPDIVIGTPGRFIDLERNSSSFEVGSIEILVLDEADRMLEEGFADELNEILSKIPKSRQTMLFSATMTSKVDDLIRAGLRRPVRLVVDAQKSTVAGLVQEFLRLRPGRENKRLAYLMYLCNQVHTDRTIVFFRQKKEAHRTRILFALSGLKAAELHGSMTQEQRLQAIEAFRSGRAWFLLATDLASRGLDIKGIETVINYEAPQSHEIYLHRVGRTARAGRSGKACTLAAESDRKVVKAAVKAARAQGAQIKQRSADPAEVDAWQTKIEGLQHEIDDILREEKEEAVLQNTERDLTRAENIVTHREEILSRPKKTWFESEKDKDAAKKKGAHLLNGISDEAPKAKKGKVKLSNKKKKKLQAKDERKDGRMWKKGKGR